MFKIRHHPKPVINCKRTKFLESSEERPGLSCLNLPSGRRLQRHSMSLTRHFSRADNVWSCTSPLLDLTSNETVRRIERIERYTIQQPAARSTLLRVRITRKVQWTGHRSTITIRALHILYRSVAANRIRWRRVLFHVDGTNEKKWRSRWRQMVRGTRLELLKVTEANQRNESNVSTRHFIT